ncbi:MAG: 16S rRNA (guanine(527)-N(7))-methyltransferase RsmG [Tenericutes bacterium GWC2_34_14]|nr:MAG: 16S rRNA (guanine(527)-N(7))-methyltransferase RsmG [Tenericutes bacterium GWC2_34_14]OHE33031.1 MAG: 16S rRNA (guanine(527)-N(7))-methyltransferase RsmG [Tenericutes bacterium GWE2_34_108]OHE36003.1 MAG: 16S rRNA (guanine(527)-N(7))-methyltransferase RsmG [Tenericutes bacterium GWF1_35_14]OHE39226.1 MAG: 16S rRNA (guanine(527)-N(7))-methyltransferase RsmG [Tenericutes bacterium GWF2_35_184]OHE42432.1 MAG: 16S rRNA (guanine(527)-N(7))-methyltransferase RsmG [Tenericutes bacterium RIFOXY
MDFKIDIKKELKLEVTPEQMHLFEIYYEFLISYNQITNLTRITEINEVFYKHFYDSLSLVNVLDFNHIDSVCDMGAGAGFPSIPLKIMFPHLKITIVDSLNKRITFLTQLVEKLHLSDISLYHQRIEEFAINHQNEFDVVTARALGHLSLISEMGIPMVKNDHFFIAPKGQQAELEIEEAENAIKYLGGQIVNKKQFELPQGYGQRMNILIKKTKHISGFPRTYTQMMNKPL